MNLLNILIIALGLAMDCLAIAIACGILFRKIRFWPFFKIAFFFGLFQGVMPIIGWLVGSTFNEFITEFDHWIAFAILIVLGIRMIHEQIKNNKNPFRDRKIDPTKLKVILVLALATSIDALAVGLSFAFLDYQPYYPALVIGITAFLMSMFGLYMGSRYACRFKLPAELIGGLVLIGIGVKILIEHLFF